MRPVILEAPRVREVGLKKLSGPMKCRRGGSTGPVRLRHADTITRLLTLDVVTLGLYVQNTRRTCAPLTPPQLSTSVVLDTPVCGSRAVEDLDEVGNFSGLVYSAILNTVKDLMFFWMRLLSAFPHFRILPEQHQLAGRPLLQSIHANEAHAETQTVPAREAPDRRWELSKTNF